MSELFPATARASAPGPLLGSMPRGGRKQCGVAWQSMDTGMFYANRNSAGYFDHAAAGVGPGGSGRGAGQCFLVHGLKDPRTEALRDALSRPGIHGANQAVREISANDAKQRSIAAGQSRVEICLRSE